MQKFFAIASGVLSLIAYAPYAFAMIKSKGVVRPNRAGWFVWWLVDATMLWALYSAHAYSAMPMFAGFTLGSTVILLLSLKGGDMKFTRLDVGCVAVALVGIVVWRMFAIDNPAFSVVANVGALIMGTIPTIMKSLTNPESEDLLTWKIFATGGICGVLAIPALTFVDALPAISTLLIQLGIIVSIFIGKKHAIR